MKEISLSQYQIYDKHLKTVKHLINAKQSANSRSAGVYYQMKYKNALKYITETSWDLKKRFQ